MKNTITDAELEDIIANRVESLPTDADFNLSEEHADEAFNLSEQHANEQLALSIEHIDGQDELVMQHLGLK